MNAPYKIITILLTGVLAFTSCKDKTSSETFNQNSKSVQTISTTGEDYSQAFKYYQDDLNKLYFYESNLIEAKGLISEIANFMRDIDLKLSENGVVKLGMQAYHLGPNKILNNEEFKELLNKTYYFYAGSQKYILWASQDHNFSYSPGHINLPEDSFYEENNKTQFHPFSHLKKLQKNKSMAKQVLHNQVLLTHKHEKDSFKENSSNKIVNKTMIIINGKVIENTSYPKDSNKTIVYKKTMINGKVIEESKTAPYHPDDNKYIKKVHTWTAYGHAGLPFKFQLHVRKLNVK